jgi:outer membrane protein assembly complex protein YaeT
MAAQRAGLIVALFPVGHLRPDTPVSLHPSHLINWRHPLSPVRSFALPVVLVAAWLWLPASVAHGQDTPEAPAAITVASLRFVGVDAIDEASVREVMRTASPSWVPFSKKPVYRARDLKEDADRIRALYVSRGFPDARVARVVADVDPEERTAAIVITVDEGAPRVAGRVAFEGFEGVPARSLERVRATSGFTTGQPLDERWVEALQEGGRHVLRESGHAQAVVHRREDLGADDAIDVTLVAEPGPRMQMGEVTVVGLTSVDRDVVRRTLAFRPGDAFRESRLDETERVLRNLELFEFAYVQPRRDEAVDGQVPIRVTVAEARHRRVDMAAGYGTEEQARGQISWRDVNVAGQGRTVGLEGRASSLEWGARASVLEPYVFTRHFSLGGSAQWWYENEPIYDMRTYGGRASLTWQRDTRDLPRARGALTSAAVTVINDYTRYSVSDFAVEDPEYRSQLISLGLNPETGRGQGTLVGLRLQLQRTSVLNPLDAHQGTALTFAVERGGGPLSGDFDYTEVVGEARAYRTGPGRSVLALRGRAGAISGGDTQGAVPFFKRYFLGGSSSLRGWGRYDISPLTSSGLPVGGLALVETSAEVRMPVWSSLALVGFVDAGNVWRSPGEADLGDLRVSVGPGLRYGTPIGPLRLDVGYQLTPIDGLVVRGRPESRQWRLHLSIGQAF